MIAAKTQVLLASLQRIQAVRLVTQKAPSSAAAAKYRVGTARSAVSSVLGAGHRAKSPGRQKRWEQAATSSHYSIVSGALLKRIIEFPHRTEDRPSIREPARTVRIRHAVRTFNLKRSTEKPSGISPSQDGDAQIARLESLGR